MFRLLIKNRAPNYEKTTSASNTFKKTEVFWAKMQSTICFWNKICSTPIVTSCSSWQNARKNKKRKIFAWKTTSCYFIHSTEHWKTWAVICVLVPNLHNYSSKLTQISWKNTSAAIKRSRWSSIPGLKAVVLRRIAGLQCYKSNGCLKRLQQKPHFHWNRLAFLLMKALIILHQNFIVVGDLSSVLQLIQSPLPTYSNFWRLQLSMNDFGQTERVEGYAGFKITLL